jgi:hypothetical protein
MKFDDFTQKNWRELEEKLKENNVSVQSIQRIAKALFALDHSDAMDIADDLNALVDRYLKS